MDEAIKVEDGEDGGIGEPVTGEAVSVPGSCDVHAPAQWETKAMELGAVRGRQQ